MEYIIDSIDSLKKLQTEKGLKSTIRRIKVTRIDEHKAKSLEAKLNSHYFACGCKEGAMAIYSSIVVLFLLWWLSRFAHLINWWIVIIIIAASSLVGKLVGLLVSRYILNKAFAEIDLLMRV